MRAGSAAGYKVPTVKVPTTAMLACDEGNDLLRGSGICLGWLGSAMGGRGLATKRLIRKPAASTAVAGTAT
jgi:hypothetical protein